MEKLTPEELAAWTQFAVAAMNGLIVSPEKYSLRNHFDMASEASYAADAMLVEWRKRRDTSHEPAF